MLATNVKRLVKKTQFCCLHCKKTDEREKYFEIFDDVGVRLKLKELLFKYFKLKVVKTNSRRDQVICEQCLDQLTIALDEDEYKKQQHKKAAEAKKRPPAKCNLNTRKVVMVKATNHKGNYKDNKIIKKKIVKIPKKATPLKQEKTIEISEDDDKEDYIQEILKKVFANNSTETEIVEQSVPNEEATEFVISEEGNVGNVANVDDDKVIAEGTQKLFDDIEKFNESVSLKPQDDIEFVLSETEGETISLKTKNGIEFVISGGGVDCDGDIVNVEHSGVNNADETYEDFERIEEGSQDGIEMYTLLPFTKEDDDQFVDITSFLDEAIKSNLTTFMFSWSTKCHICSWNCKTFESLVVHVYGKHNLTNNLYACPSKDCDQKLEGKKLFTRHLILNHGPLDKLLIYGSCPDCGLTFSNFMVFNRHSCARMIKRRRGMRLHCILCEIDFSSMKRYVFHMQFHLEKHRPKVCFICNYKTNDIEELFEHINYDHQLQDVYPCRICDRSFKEKQNLLDHKHANNVQFVCKECNRSYHFKASLMAHIKSSHAPVLQCNLCYKVLSSEANYRYHIKSHMNASTALNACSNCGLICADRSRILDHVNEEGSDCFGVEIEDEVLSVAYTCEFCLLDFKSKCDLKLHRSTGVHADGQFFCFPCNQSFATMKLYRTHRKHVISEWKKENLSYLFVCNVDDCDESYTRWNSLYTHKRRHHNAIKPDDDADFEEEHPEDKAKNKTKTTESFVCQFCDKECPTKMSLSVHIARRHNNKNVECSICNASFKNEQALQKHFDYLHVPIECSKCLKVVKNRRNFDVHERVVHMAEKRYFCQVCSKGFYHKGDKEAHAKLHEERYSCEQCDFTTSYAKSLEIHFSSIHQREFKYECETCKQKFARKPALATHVAKHCKLKRFMCQKPKYKSCYKTFSTLALLNKHFQYAHNDDDDDDDQSMPPSDHEEGPAPAKRSKRLQLKNNENDTISDNTNNDGNDVNVVDPIKIDLVSSNDENDIQDTNSIDIEVVDAEIEQFVNAIIQNQEKKKNEKKKRKRKSRRY